MKTIIIAEAGINHNGKIQLAKKLILAAANAGANYIKFQTYKTENMIVPNSKLASYQKNNMKKSQSQFEMLKKYELKENFYKILIKYAKSKKIKFLSSPFDTESISFLNKLNLDFIKIPSGEIDNYPYLKTLGKLNTKIILSTGMSDLNEVNNAIKILKKYGTNKKNISILHCHSAYPSHLSNLNLNVIQTLKKKFNLRIGFSDHSDGINAAVIAVALGAEIIEKHLTLNREMLGPDHKASINPHQFKNMVNQIKITEKMLGNGKKIPTKNELKNKPFARKSLVAKIDIKKGEKFSEKNLTTKRPARGISPMRFNSYLKKKANKKYFKDDLI
jgi:N,N'-diacetyllegionaminate synthase